MPRGELAPDSPGAWRPAGFGVCLFAPRGRAWQPSRVPGEPAPDDAAGLRAANARLREVIAAKDAETAVLRAAQD